MAATHMTFRILTHRSLFSNSKLCRRIVSQIPPVHNKFTTPPPQPGIYRFSTTLATVKDNIKQERKQTKQEDQLYSSVDLEIKSHDKAVLRSYVTFVSMVLENLGISYSKSNIPKDILRYTLLKSVHVHKKALAQYEMRTEYKVITMTKLTGSTADTVLEYIERNLPEGVAMKVTKHRLARLTKHLQSPIAVIEEKQRKRKEPQSEKITKTDEYDDMIQEYDLKDLFDVVSRKRADKSSGKSTMLIEDVNLEELDLEELIQKDSFEERIEPIPLSEDVQESSTVQVKTGTTSSDISQPSTAQDINAVLGETLFSEGTVDTCSENSQLSSTETITTSSSESDSDSSDDVTGINDSSESSSDESSSDNEST